MRIGNFDISLSNLWRGSGQEAGEQRGVESEMIAKMNGNWMPSDNTSTVVTRETALQIPAVYAAVKVVAETLASLPWDLYKRTDGGSELATNHPLYYVTKHEPQPYVTGYNFRRTLFANACFGDSYAKIVRNGVGRTVALVPVNAYAYHTAENQLYYVATPLSGFSMTQEILFPWEIIHIKGISMDGVIGEDVVQTHRTTFSVSLSASQYGDAFFANGAHLSGFITYPGTAKPENIENIRKQFNNRHAGVKKAGSTAVLDNGADYKKISLTPQEAMLNETRDHQNREVAKIFGIPLHLLQDLGDTTFNNVETMSRQFVTTCLAPWAVQAEQEFAIKTLTEQEKRSGSHFYRLDLSGLLRGDTAARTAYYASGIQWGWLTREDARELEDFNRIAGLEKPLFPTNMTQVGPDGNPEPLTPAEPVTPAVTGTNATDNGTPQAGK